MPIRLREALSLEPTTEQRKTTDNQRIAEVMSKPATEKRDPLTAYVHKLEGQNTNFLEKEQQKIQEELMGIDKQISKLSKDIAGAFDAQNTEELMGQDEEETTQLLEEAYTRNKESSIDVTASVRPLMQERERLIEKKKILGQMMMTIDKRLGTERADNESGIGLDTLTKKIPAKENLRQNIEKTGRQMVDLWEDIVRDRKMLDGMKLGFFKSLKFSGEPPLAPDANQITAGLEIATEIDHNELAKKGKNKEAAAIKDYLENLYHLEDIARQYSHLAGQEAGQQLQSLKQTILEQNKQEDERAEKEAEFNLADKAWFEEGESPETLEAIEWDPFFKMLEDQEFFKKQNAANQEEIKQARKFRGDKKDFQITKAQLKILEEYKKSPNYHLASPRLEEKALKQAQQQVNSEVTNKPTLMQTMRKWGLRTAAALGIAMLFKPGTETTQENIKPPAAHTEVVKVAKTTMTPRATLELGEAEVSTPKIKKNTEHKPQTTQTRRTKPRPEVSLGEKVEQPIIAFARGSSAERNTAAKGSFQQAIPYGPESRIFDSKSGKYFRVQDIELGGEPFQKITNEKTGEVKYKYTPHPKTSGPTEAQPQEISFTQAEDEQYEDLTNLKKGTINLPTAELGTVPGIANRKEVNLKQKLAGIELAASNRYKPSEKSLAEIKTQTEITSTLMTNFGIPRNHASSIEQAIKYAKAKRADSISTNRKTEWWKRIKGLEHWQENITRDKGGIE